MKMTCTDQFSVSLCVYEKDDPRFFKTAIDSIIHQTRPPDEIVLVVDGPVGEALAGVIEEYEKLDLFRVVRLKKNSGHGNARRTGLEQCRFPLIALMDADDISRPDRFEKQLAVFQADSTIDIVGGNIAEFYESPAQPTGYRIVQEQDAAIKEYMKKRCPMNQVTVMFRRAAVEQAGGYIDWFCNEDYYLWIRMALHGARFANVRTVLVDVRMDKAAISRRGGYKYFRSEAGIQTYLY
ncbi:MAG: glycosyltransferase, partial [Alphaproteobacteria bacterium]|nr:glycosyltransferase [Alphaproteobacteria bacterium]